MDNENAQNIIQALADGVDPITGEILPEGSPYKDDQVISAFQAAVKVLNHKIKSDERRSSRPAGTGKRWTAEEDQQVCEAFDKGKSVTEIANDHERTRGAIQSRLLKLGKIQIAPDIETSKELTS